MGRCGSLWIVVGRCGSLWVVPGFSNYDLLSVFSARSSVRLSNRPGGGGAMAVLWKGDRRLLNRCYHPIKLLIKDKVVGDRD